MDITNDATLQTLIRNDLKAVIDDVIDKIIEENKDLIDEIVYSQRVNPTYATEMGGQPTYQFRESWDGSTKINGDKVEGEFKQNTDENNPMNYYPYSYIHGSLASGYIGQALAEIIYEGKSGDIWGEGYWTQPRDVWTPLIQKIDNKLDDWIIAAFAKRGITARKGSAGKIYW